MIDASIGAFATNFSVNSIENTEKSVSPHFLVASTTLGRKRVTKSQKLQSILMNFHGMISNIGKM